MSIMPLVEGYCEESGSFEPVRELFTQGFKDGFEDNNAQLCVYINGKLIIDLFGCQNQENPDKYGHDSLQVSTRMNKSVCVVKKFNLLFNKKRAIDTTIPSRWFSVAAKVPSPW